MSAGQKFTKSILLEQIIPKTILSKIKSLQKFKIQKVGPDPPPPPKKKKKMPFGAVYIFLGAAGSEQGC